MAEAVDDLRAQFRSLAASFSFLVPRSDTLAAIFDDVDLQPRDAMRLRARDFERETHERGIELRET